MDPLHFNFARASYNGPSAFARPTCRRSSTHIADQPQTSFFTLSSREDTVPLHEAYVWTPGIKPATQEVRTGLGTPQSPGECSWTECHVSDDSDGDPLDISKRQEKLRKACRQDAKIQGEYWIRKGGRRAERAIAELRQRSRRHRLRKRRYLGCSFSEERCRSEMDQLQHRNTGGLSRAAANPGLAVPLYQTQ